MDFGDFISTFPRFPQHAESLSLGRCFAMGGRLRSKVSIVRASLGTEGHETQLVALELRRHL